jgi:hypothetical protein
VVSNDVTSGVVEVGVTEKRMNFQYQQFLNFLGDASKIKDPTTSPRHLFPNTNLPNLKTVHVHTHNDEARTKTVPSSSQFDSSLPVCYPVCNLPGGKRLFGKQGFDSFGSVVSGFIGHVLDVPVSGRRMGLVPKGRVGGSAEHTVWDQGLVNFSPSCKAARCRELL